MSQNDYWAERKMEEQRKSTEMRKSKYAEMKAKGYDMSAVNSDVLDAAKTDESAFWNAMKGAMSTKDASNRQNIANELKKNGFDTSLLTADALNPAKTDEGAFWKLVKVIKESRESEIKASRSPYNEHFNSKKNSDSNKEKEEKNHWYAVPERSGGTSHVSSDREKAQVQVPNVRKERPALSEKTRNYLIKKFETIPESRKETYYVTAKANLEAQLNKANLNKNTRLAKKLMETLEILEYILGSDESEDEWIINSALPE